MESEQIWRTHFSRRDASGKTIVAGRRGNIVAARRYEGMRREWASPKTSVQLNSRFSFATVLASVNGV